jgi:hypothetical protein
VPTRSAPGGADAHSIFHNAYVFADSYDLIGGDVFQSLHLAAWPANLDGIGFGGFA